MLNISQKVEHSLAELELQMFSSCDLFEIGLDDICQLCLIGEVLDGRCCHCHANFQSKWAVNYSGYIQEVSVNAFGSKRHGKLQHVLIAEKALGRELPEGVVVHHHDKNRSNNSNQNLVICEDRAYHSLIHARMRSFEHGANPDIEGWCPRCNTVKPRDQFYLNPRGVFGIDQMCIECQLLRRKNFYARKKAAA